MTIFEKKPNKKIKKKNMWGKLKQDYQPAQYWKNIFDKDNLKKNMWGNTVRKQKLCRRNTVAIHIVFFL